ncbi:uncharacterized protein B0H64DRAFT_414142 [Chaetomium fimeti]|uniref:Xylanolytic transcriptional activator regulatory domain-containing protein n=1 Tax=Chaetomium fimeti TaxID=1854472 RepID=A0AAE0HNT4_9PEZI|nr:hypothetical protein B0H64DRAFT_414142 [Chaetomium fimeti]
MATVQGPANLARSCLRFLQTPPLPSWNHNCCNVPPCRRDRPDRASTDSDHDDSGSDIDVSGALNGLGYLPHHHHLVLGQGPGPKYCLVDNWLNGANHQYYALYPPEFRTQYDGWWATPRNKVTPELTSLILRVCACSLHFIIDDNVRVRLETDLDTDVLTFADRMHAAAQKLGASIPLGKGGLVHVQQLFLTAFWFKSAEKWAEAWNALSRAIPAANEIGLHQDSSSEGMSEYDREMRRRMWVILYLWDFALGSMLSRPFMIDRAHSTVVMPTLTLENNRERPDQPSQFRHMNLHCQLCIDLAAVLAKDSDSETGKAEAAQRMQGAVENWFAKLPAEYAVKSPETRWDREFDWVVFQRRYLHLIGYMGLFSQLKPFLTRSSAKPMSELESKLREAGVDAALGLMDVSWKLFENLASVGAKFHYAIFCIFDAATVMCSAFLQDEARNLPQRETVLEAVKKSLGMLAEVSPESKTTAALYRILKDLLTKLPLSTREQGVTGAAKRVKNERSTPPSDRALAMKSPSVPSSQRTRPEGRRNHKPRHRSSSASSNSDSTMDSSKFQPRSESSVSVPDSCRSINPRVSSEVQPQPRSVVPSNGVAPAAGLSSSSNFVPVHPAYPGATGSFMPATNTMPAAVYMPPEAYNPGPGYVQEPGFQYPSQSPVDALPFSQPGWQPPQAIEGLGSNVPMYQNGGLPGFDSSPPPQQPALLEYWGWQGLGLGHPSTWPVPLPDQSGMRQHYVDLPGGFDGRGMLNDCGESASTDLSR